MRKSNNIELKEGYIYSFYYDDSPDSIFHFIVENNKAKVLLYEHGCFQYALFSGSDTCFQTYFKPNLKELGKANSKLKIILTLGLCGFLEDKNNDGILKSAYKSFYKRGAK